MSNEAELEGTNIYIDWLEKSIESECIVCYKYSDFKCLQKIGSGAFGSVVRATWKNSDSIFALKSFTNNKTTLKEVVNEVN